MKTTVPLELVAPLLTGNEPEPPYGTPEVVALRADEITDDNVDILIEVATGATVNVPVGVGEHDPHTVDVMTDVIKTVLWLLETALGAGRITLAGNVMVVSGALLVMVEIATDVLVAGARIALAANVTVVNGELSTDCDCAITVARKAETKREAYIVVNVIG